MPLVTRSQFLQDLRSSRLLADAHLHDLESEAARNPSAAPHDLARRLVDRGLITHWQAKMLLSGQTAFFLGKYKLIKELGRGGMGAVFQAQQAPHGRMVALKVMAQNLVQDQAAIARFQREIQASAALNHPNIVTAFDADHVQNTHFLVMEFVEGESLDEVLKREKRIPIATACEYIRQAARGLQHAYEQGMAHRDIKPSNLLIAHTPDGKPLVKILDMGLARFTSETREAGELTSTGQILGTPDYIAPEQAKNTKSADIRSDIFSLGCTLFRALAGRIPFAGDSIMEKLSSRLLDDAPRLRTVLPEAPVELEAVVQKMLAREPARRYQIPAEVVKALEPFARTQPEARPSTSSVSPAASLTPDEFSASPDAAVNQFLEDLKNEATLGGLGAETLTAGENPDEQSSGQPAGRSRTAAPRTKPTKGAARDGQRLLRKKRVLLAAVAVLGVLAGGLAWWGWQKAGEATLVLDWPESARSEATFELDGATHSLPRQGPVRFRVSPGKRALVLKRQGYQEIREILLVKRGEERLFTPEWQARPGTARKVSWETLRDRARTTIQRLKTLGAVEVAAADPEMIRLRDELVRFYRTHPGSKESVETARLIRRFPWPVDRLKREAIPADVLRRAGHGDASDSPAEIVAVFGDSRLKMWGRGSCVALHPEGALVAAVGHYEGYAYLWNTNTGDLLRKLPTSAGPTTICFSGDGARLACGGNDSATVWDTESVSQVAELPQKNVASVALNRDGTTLAAISDNGHVLQMWDVSSKTVKWKREERDKQMVLVALTPDGRFLAHNTVPAGFVEILDATDGRLLKQLPANSYVPSRFTDDGELLFLSTEDGNIQCWETDQWKLRQEFSGRGQGLAAIDGAGTRCLTRSGRDLSVWNMSSGERLWTHPAGEYLIYGSLSRDGARAVVLDAAGGVQVWDVSAGRRMHETPGPLSAMLSVRASPGGDGIAGGSTDGTIRRWEFGRDEVRYMLAGHTGGAIVLGFSADGRSLFAAASDERVHVWDDSTGLPRDAIVMINHFAAHTMQEFRNSAAVSSDGRRIACGGGHDGSQVLLVDRETRQEILLSGHQPGIAAVGFSANGAKLATGAIHEPAIRVWDTRTGRRERVLQIGEQQGVTCLVFDPSMPLVYAGGAAFGTDLTAWNLETGLKVNAWSEHTNVVHDIAVSPDGRRVATTAMDGQVIIWNAQERRLTLEQKIQLAPAGAVVLDLDFTPDGRHLLTANGNGTIYVLRLNEWSASLDGEQ